MTGIETDAEPFLAVCALDDGGDFLEAAPDLRSLARHGLQEHDRLLRRIEDVVQNFGNKLYAFFCALLHMAAGVEVVERVRDMLKACEVICHRFACEGAQVFLGGAGVHRIGRMGDERADAVLFTVAAEGAYVVHVERLRPAAARVACKEGEDVGIEVHCGLSHGEIAAGRRKVTADVKRMVCLLHGRNSVSLRWDAHVRAARLRFFFFGGSAVCFLKPSQRKNASAMAKATRLVICADLNSPRTSSL